MDFSGKTVTVTGGLGLIGTFLVDKLWHLGAIVTVVDNESNGSWRYLDHLRGRVVYINADLSNTQVEMGEYVFHLASIMRGIKFSGDNPDLIYGHDSAVNMNVVESIINSGTVAAVFASSACVYSDSCDLFDDSCTTYGPEAANFAYGYAKMELEAMGTRMDIPIASVRPSNVYGDAYIWKGDDSGVMPSLVTKVMKGGEIEIWGSGEQKRNFVYAGDCADLMIRLMGHNTVVNLGHEKTISMIELAKKIAKIGQVGISIRRDYTKPEGKPVKTMSSTKLSGLVGPIEWTSLDTGIEHMVDWFLSYQ